ncbi:MAG: methyl-accepting chemotaxis protein [Myxococcaceae bacterium]
MESTNVVPTDVEPTNDGPPVGRVAGRRLKLRWKILALCAGSVVPVVLGLTLALSARMHSHLKDEHGARARAQAALLAEPIGRLPNGRDKAALEPLVAQFLEAHRDAAYAVVQAASGEIVFRGVRQELREGSQGSLARLPEVKGSSREHSFAGLDVLEVIVPIGPSQAATVSPAPAKATDRLRVGFELRPLGNARRSFIAFGLLLGLLLAVVSLFAPFVINRFLVKPIESLSVLASGIASGDLRQVVELDQGEDLGELGASFVSMASALRGMVVDLQAASAELEREAATILSTAQQQSLMATQQAASIGEASATSSEIAQTSKQATEYAESAIKATQRAEELSHEGQQVVDESVAGMGKLVEQVHAIALSITELSERTLQIGDIITTVKDLAEKSNMVALNASIEAARAGEQGKGFAIVAMEMRNLAERSKLAAEQIRAILGEVQKGTRAAVIATEEGSKRASSTITLAQSAGGTIANMAQAGRETSLAARQIANNSRQQTTGVEQLVTVITDQSKAMNDALENSKRIERVASSVSSVSKSLSAVVSRYRV